MGTSTENLVLVVRAKNRARGVLRGVSRDLDKMDAGTSKFGQTALKVGKFGAKAFVGIGVAAAGLAAVGVASFAKFEDKMNQSLAIMGSVPQELRDQMSDTARAIAKETRLGATEAAESYFFLASAGLDAKQSIAALPQVAAFAQAGMFDMATATDLATDAQSALGLVSKDSNKNLENMTRVTDVLVKANTLANASVQQFSESLTNKAGAALKVVNKDIEEGVAVLAAFADQGIKGAEAGTALNIVMRDMQTKAIKNKNAFREYGVEVFDSSGKMRNMADIIGDMENALAGMSDEQKKATLAQLGFSDKSVIFIQTLLGTSEKIRQYEKDLRDAGGTTQEVADKQMESLSAQFDVLGSKAQDVLIGLGEDLAPTIKDELVPALDSMLDSTAMFAETIGPGLIKVVGWAVDAMVGFQMVVLDFIGIWDDEARRKARQIVLNKELREGLGENMTTSKRLTAAMITLGKQDAWTEDGLKSLIATTGASAAETRLAAAAVLEHAEAAGWDAKWIEMLRSATEDSLIPQDEWIKGIQAGAEELTMYRGGLEETADAYEDVADETQEAIDAQAEYTDQLRALSDPVFGAVKGMQGLIEAEDAVAELQKKGKKGTAEWNLAMLDLAEATFGAQDALDEISEENLVAALDAIGAATGQSREEVALMLEELGILDGMDVAVALRISAPVVTYSVTEVEGKYHVKPSSGGTSSILFQEGGRFFRGDELIVGEDGIEFITAATSGTVVSNPNTTGGNFNDFFGEGSTSMAKGITIQELNIVVEDDLRDPGAGRRFIERLVDDIDEYNRERVV